MEGSVQFHRRLTSIFLVSCNFWWLAPASAAPDPALARVRAARLLAAALPDDVPTGILYDRVVPLVDARAYDGTPAARPATLAAWRQILHEMSHASLGPPAWPDAESVAARARERVARGIVPVALLDFEYERLAPEGAASGPFERARTFAAAPLCEYTYRGREVQFEFGAAWYATNSRAGAMPGLAADFGDGRGFRAVRAEEPARVHYDTPGRKLVRVEVRRADGSRAFGTFQFDVRALTTPSPDDTLHVVAAEAYNGVQGTGDAYVYYGAGHTSLVKPVVVLEGFDLDNNMNWDELYQLLNQQNLLETLRAEGFDTVVLNFTDATDFMQRNAYVASTLIAQVHAAAGPEAAMVVVGASMGGVVGRFALAHLEQQGVPTGVRTFISFDGPQRGADIPLGIQYWMQFFAGQSADAAHLQERLATPAARQLLVYHATSPPSSTASADPMRAQFLADLASAGSYPVLPRRVAIANGSGAGVDQGFGAGAEIIRYEYSTLLLRITGDVWAVSAGASQQIFRGVIDAFFPPPEQQTTVTVSGTQSYDNAPGGWRASMAEMDSSQAPYGDIVALYQHHCFIPTVSALDLDVSDLFYGVATDPQLLTHTPFHAVYFPAENQEHITITPENAAWFLFEVRGQPTEVAAAPAAGGRLVLHPNVPNPFNPTTRLEFDVPQAGVVDLSVFDTRGRHLVTLQHGEVAAGRHHTFWDGRLASGARAPSGVYTARLQGPGGTAARRLVLLQ
jgi:hypothetical protein